MTAYGSDDEPLDGDSLEDDPASRLRRLIEKRQAESIEILRSWMETEEEHA
jgi:flagellar M-ring protein FliF